MAEMEFGLKPDPELEPKRAKTLLISIAVHIALLIFLVLNPDLLVQTPKRTIRIAGQDYDLSKEELTQLVMPPCASAQASGSSSPRHKRRRHPSSKRQRNRRRLLLRPLRLSQRSRLRQSPRHAAWRRAPSSMGRQRHREEVRRRSKPETTEVPTQARKTRENQP